MKYGFKRILSIFLAVLMLASMLPLSVYADEEECLHEYTAEVTDPTCTEQGYTTYTCSLCGSSYEDDYTEASGHTPADAEEVPATCTESGRTAGTVCAVCGEALSGCEEIPASGHSYEAAVTEPTDTEQGYTTYTCALCGDSYTDNYTGPNADGEELLNPEAEELSGLGLSLMASGSPEDIVDSGTCGTSLTWKLDKNGLLTVSGSGAMADYGSADAPWYKYCSLIKSVIIENGVTTIGSNAFWGCTELSSITIPASVTSIGDYAFARSSLASITIPDSIESIRDYAFAYSALTSITIPSSVTTIGSGVLHECGALTSISVASGNTVYSGADNCLIEKGSGTLILGCKNSVIPEGVKSIGDSAFRDCSGLTNITIPASVETIGNYAFKGCTGLTSITIPVSVTSIGPFAFEGCSNLASITIPASVTRIKEMAFNGCGGLADVFYKGTSDKWNRISIDASGNDCLTNAKIHYSVADFGECGNNLSWVLDTNGLLTVSGSGAMADYDLWATPRYSIINSIKSVVIENGVTTIGSYAFYGCYSLTSITIPDSVETIGDSAFEGCSKLASVCFNGTVAQEKALRSSTAIGNDMLLNIKWVILKDKGTCGDNVSWKLDTNGVLTISGSEAMPDYGSAGAPWYKYYSLIKSAIIENGVTSIGRFAFTGCSNLTSINIPSSVTSIGSYAFSDCAGLASIEIPASVETIGSYAFNGCNHLTNITILASVKSIGEGVFQDCTGLTSITIPDSVKSIGEYAFNGCSSLASITVPYGVTSIGGFAFNGCSNLTSITIPSSVTSIGEGVFQDCTGLTSITIPSSVTSIGNNAFQDCTGLTSITIPDSVKSIGEYAFNGCKKLTSITLPEGLTTIGDYAFSNCTGLTSITIPSSVTTIGSGVLRECGTLTSISVASGNTKYSGDGNCLIEKDSGTLIRGCNNSIIPAEGVKSIGKSAFSGCTGLTSITIPASVKSIDDGSFKGCENLTSITIPSSVTSIGIQAFYSCSKLADVFYKGTSEEWYKITIDASTNDCLTKAKIHYSVADFGECGENLSWVLDTNGVLTISGTGAMADYGFWATPWYSYGDLIKSVVIENGVTSIGSYAFCGCEVLTSITIPASVETIGFSAFEGCTGLTSITIPDSVKSIGEGAFQGCKKLTSITLPEGLTTIGFSAFEGCINLTSITIPASVTSISGDAFEHCSALTSISVVSGNTKYSGDGNCLIEKDSGTLILGCKNSVIPEGVKSIGACAFYDCTGLTNITIPSSVTTIDSYAFYNCSSLASITIPDSVKSIGFWAFCDCTGLTSITIPASVTSIGIGAFEGCSNLTSITIPDSVTSILDSAFSGCDRLADVFYKGTSDEWNRITIGSNNDCLTEAHIHHSLTGGECGENRSWVLYADGTLYIAGTGVMTGYGSPSDTPWYSFSESIKSVVIEHGVTSIGSNAFKSCAGLTSVTIPGSVTSVGSAAFYGCSGLMNVYYNGTPLDWKKISIGSSNGCLTEAKIICSIPFAETVTISHDSQDITGQTVDADIYRDQTYQLTAAAAPDNAKQQFTWASSSTAVATVDTNGLVTFRKPGTVTITAAATDGSGKNAKVTFNVFYYDAAAKFTVSTDAPSIGLEVGHRAQISVFGEDKTTALDSYMFSYTLSNVKNGPFIKVSGPGEITAIEAGGTTTVTAALKGDPLNRKVTVSVKTIPVQTKTVFVLPPDSADIHTANDNYAEGFCAIDANGNIPFSAEEAVSYALFVNKVPKGTTAEPRFVKVNAIDSDGNPISLPNTDYTWTSSNTKIATVAKDGTVTIKSNVDGACTITATSKDLAKAQGSISVYVMDKTPRLDAAKVTLDVQKTNEVTVGLVSSYGAQIVNKADVVFQEYNSKTKAYADSTRIEIAGYNSENGLLTLKASGFLKNQTIKGQLVVKTKGNPTPYELPFSVVIKNSAPSVTVKQPSKFNLFYTDSSAALNVSVKNEQIDYIELVESDYFKGTDNGDGTVTVEFKTPDPKPVTKATLKIHLVGYEQPVEKAITIGTVTTKPKLTVTPASAVINTLLGGSESEFAVYNNASGEYIDVTNMTTAAAWASLTGEGTNAVLTLTGTTGGKAAISVRESNWASPITVYHTVNVKATDPVAKPGTGTLTLNSNFLNIAETTLTLDQANVSITGINKELTVVPSGVDKDVAEDWFEVAYADGKITAKFSDAGKTAIGSGALKTGTYSFSITPYVEGVDLNPVTLKISVKNTIPTVTASAVTLNKRLNETGVSTLKLSAAGYTVTGAVVSESNPNLYVTFNNGTLTVKLNSEAKALKAQTFNVTLTPTVEMDGYEAAVEAKPFTLKVSMIDKAPSASVSASGKIDVIVKGSGITYTLTKLNNAVGSVSSAELDGDNASMFTLTKLEPNDKGQPGYMLTLKDDAVCAANVTYKIKLRFTLDSGDVIETPVLNVKPAQSALKLTAAPAAQIFYQSQSRDRVVTYTVKLTSPAGAEIGSIVPGKVSFWQNSLADQTKKIVISLDPNDKSMATVAITLKDTARFTSGKSYTLPLEVSAEGYPGNISSAKLNLTLKVMK